ncbi:riboflavin synthase [Legionella israelensis]|uniref:riboflavin synthase n=1 Tax=Legionella israelensis TaxID=454 RepID=UPI00117BE932|nr:riboflavin synthase [Legionella israelensis]QDP72966.1 riboflavin synthase [Legionella israelensis]
MFTGIIEQQGKVMENVGQKQAHYLTLTSDFDSLSIGESIAVNGVCLTLASIEKNVLGFDISPETLAKTNLAQLTSGSSVNLERAMSAHSRFGGHYVSGHVDGLAIVKEKKVMNEYIELTISGFQADEMKFLLPKGSISINGVSLTINRVLNNSIELMLVPHTLSLTNLGDLYPDQQVNIEFDYLTRIVAHQLQHAGHLTNER